MIYKISGTWGNHEGSLLLWIVILVSFAAILTYSGGGDADGAEKTRTLLAVQGIVTAAFLAFSLFTSNPFARLSPAPLDGNGLNPVLQDPGLALHPPTYASAMSGFQWRFPLPLPAFLTAGLTAPEPSMCAGSDHRSLVRADHRDRAWQLVGLLRRLGRLVVLGSGGKCLADAVACGDSADPFSQCRGRARDLPRAGRGAAGMFLAVTGWHLHRPFGIADLGSQLCQRSGTWRFHSGDPAAGNRHSAGAFRGGTAIDQ